MRVTRIQYPVGQGCFHVGEIRARVLVDDNVNAFNYVYDCGSDDREALRGAIDNYKAHTSRVDALFVSHLDSDHVSGLDRLLSAVKVDTVYVPYVHEVVIVLELIQAELDGDLSISLIEASLDPGNWFRSRGVERIVRVQEPLDDEASDPGDGDDREPSDHSLPVSKKDPATDDPNFQRTRIPVVKSGHRVRIPISDRSLNWTLVPHVDPVPRERRGRFESRMRKVLGLPQGQPVTSARLADAMRKRSERERLRECYNEILPHGARRMHNRVSLSLYSGPVSFQEGQEWYHQVSNGPDWRMPEPFKLYPKQFLSCEAEAVGWIGSGDATLGVRKVRAAWRGTFRHYKEYVATLLLPHHGSRRNFHCEILDYFPSLELCAASAGYPSKYRHPSHFVVLEVLNRRKAFCHVSQLSETALYEEIWSP